MYDLLLKNGTVIDPSQRLNDRMDVAISEGRIQAVERSIPESGASKCVDVSGLLVVPGLVDIHTHVAGGIGGLCVDADRYCLPDGVTTAVDAGSTGHLLFRAFSELVIPSKRTRLHAFLNVESLGMIESAARGNGWTTEKWPDLITAPADRYDGLFVNLKETCRTVLKNSGEIVGIKWAHHTLDTFRLARKAADEAHTRLMAENHHMPEGLKYVRQGDILTHVFHHYFNPVARRYDGIEEGGEIRSEFHEAYRRGIVFDLGHGSSSFSWKVAEKAVAEGLRPHTISTDIWRRNVSGPVRSMTNVMSKMFCLGMGLEEIIGASTTIPAKAIGLSGIAGSLKPGGQADIAVLRLAEGRFEFTDCEGETRRGSKKFQPVHVVRDGQIVK